MAVRLTPEPEQCAHPDFEGTAEEFEALLLEGLDSPELSEDEFWSGIAMELDDPTQDIYTIEDGHPINAVR